MKILLVADFSYGALGLSYYNSFLKLGYNVTQFDTFLEMEKINPFFKNRYLNRFLEKLYYNELNSRLLKKILLLNPELVFIVKGHCIFPDTIKDIKNKLNTFVINFNPDNPFNLNHSASNKFILRSIPNYDCYCIWGKFLISKLLKYGARKCEYLPFAYDPGLHFLCEISIEEKKRYGSDIAFIGTWDKERESFLEQLIDYDLAIWGNGWERLKPNSKLISKYRKRDVIGKDFSAVCNASKIIINHVRSHNENAHNMKTFEIPACGGFMLTTRTKEQCEFFKEDKDIACFETAKELKEKINYYLTSNDLRKKIALNGYEKVRVHSYTERAKAIVSIFSNMKTYQLTIMLVIMSTFECFF